MYEYAAHPVGTLEFLFSPIHTHELEKDGLHKRRRETV
jgi:hypothetical protein